MGFSQLDGQTGTGEQTALHIETDRPTTDNKCSNGTLTK